MITKSVYDDTVSMGFQPFSCPKVTRKVEAYGMMMSMAKAPPMRKRREPMMMKGAAYFFSCSWSPGDTNFHTWKRMPGMEMKMPSTMATFIHVQKASVGEVKTSSVFMLRRGREMKRMAGSVMKKAMRMPTPADATLHMMRVRSSPRCSMNDILPRARSVSGSGATVCSSAITTPPGSAGAAPTPRPRANPSRMARVT